MRTRLLNMTLSNLRFNVWRFLVTMATNLPSCFSMQFLEQLLKFLVSFTLLKCVKSQRSYSFLITKELVFGFQILDLKDHFSASLTPTAKHPSLIDIILTNRPRSFKNSVAVETGLSDHHKMVVTVLKWHFVRIHPKTIYYGTTTNLVLMPL